MASTIKVTPQKEKISENEGFETLPDSPLLDLSDAAVKELIRSAKNRGYVNHDHINAQTVDYEIESNRGKESAVNLKIK